MSLSIQDNFQRSGYDVISCHNPLVLDVELGNSDPIAESGDVSVIIQGQSGADNTTAYTFEMAYVTTTIDYGYKHQFRLNITNIIRHVCNTPQLEDETGANIYKQGSRMATPIKITVSASGESPDDVTNYFMHGFNQVNDPDSSCLVDFASGIPKILMAYGAPSIFHIWEHTNSGSNTKLLLLDDELNVVSNISIGATFNKGLIQMHTTILNGGIYSDYDYRVKEYGMKLYYGTDTVVGEIDLIGLTAVCEGSVLLAWLNRYGTYSYMAFERFPTLEREQKHIGSYKQTITDIADVQSRALSKGYENVRTVISAVAKNIPTEYFEYIEDLFYSMDVYYYTGTLPNNVHSNTDWLRVTVEGSLKERRRYSHDNVRVDIMLPEKYTQLR